MTKATQSIYNVTFQLNKKGLIKKVGRGLFKQNRPDTTEDNIDEAISYINRMLDYYDSLNWMSCSDDELKRARANMKRLLKLSNDILENFGKSSKGHTSNEKEPLQTPEEDQQISEG